MDKQQQKFLEMTQKPVEKLVPKLAVPTVISMLITTFYNMVDTFFVGKINTSAVGAVGVVFSFMTVIQAIGFFFGHGSGNYISFMLGKRRGKEAEEMAAVGFFLSIAAGMVIMILGLIFLKPLALFLGSTETILPYTEQYLRYILIGTPYMAASLVLNNHLRFQGNAFYAMIGITSGAVLNIGLDPLLMYGFHMGISGAALATIISQFVGFCLLLVGTTKGGNIRIRLRNFKPSKLIAGEILKGGTPSLMRQALTGISTIFLNRYAGIYGDAAIAAMSIVQRIVNFASSALIGLGQGFQPVCGFSYGAGLYERVKKAFWFCIKMGFIFLTIVTIIALLAAPNLITLFRGGDADVIKIGTLALRMQALTLPATAWVVISNMMMQNIGKVYRASFLAAARQGLFLVPVLIIFSHFFGLLGIQIAQPVADLITLSFAIVLQKQELRELDMLHEKTA
ncbi:MAG: MATE family efflux transporter [Lachnospiraceae bacterium]